MERIGADVRRELGRFGPAGAMADIVAAWPAAVGESIAKNAWPARVARDGTLHVATASSAWAYELGLLAPTVLARLREALGEATPARLRFAPGPLPEAYREPPPTSAAPAAAQPSAEHRRLGVQLAGTIADQTLRELVGRAVALGLARAGGRRAV